MIDVLTPFSGSTEWLVLQPHQKGASMLVLPASGTSMLKSPLQDHVQCTQQPTQFPTQCAWPGELQAQRAGAIMC